MKVLVDADSQQLLGAAILGRNGDEVVHALLDVMAADQPYTVVSRDDAHPPDRQRTVADAAAAAGARPLAGAQDPAADPLSAPGPGR